MKSGSVSISIWLFLSFFNIFSATARDFYLSSSGSDANKGMSPASAWRSLNKLNTVDFEPGDRIFLQAGNTFSGSLHLQENDSGTAEKPILITSFGKGRANVRSEDNFGIYVENAGGIIIENIQVYGAGRKSNRNSGVIFYNTAERSSVIADIVLNKLSVHGYQQSGIMIGSDKKGGGYRNVRINGCESYNNGEAGINVYGENLYSVYNLVISRCKAYRNSGRPEIWNTHTGNGILVAATRRGLIEHCIAYENGALNNHTGGGPVGIWCYNSDSIIIQYNESYSNKAGLEADGGGFDIDGGTTNSIIQYNYSHDNEGAGYLLAQYTNAPPFYNNTIRYNISENDGRKNNNGGIALWGGSAFSDCYIYNNTVYADNEHVVEGTPSCLFLMNSNFSNILIANNVFMSRQGAWNVNSPKKSTIKNVTLVNNNFYSADGSFRINWNGREYSSLEVWRQDFAATDSAIRVGTSVDPQLEKPGKCGILNGELKKLQFYQALPGSAMIDSGADLRHPPFNLDPGNSDITGQSLFSGGKADKGAIEFHFTARKE